MATVEKSFRFLLCSSDSPALWVAELQRVMREASDAGFHSDGIVEAADSDDGDVEGFVTYFRPETEAEHDERRLRERVMSSRVEASERAEYRRLRAKFATKSK